MTKPSTSTELLKAKDEVTRAFNNGTTELAVDVSRLTRRERNILRMHANRWMRKHGWKGKTKYEQSTELLIVMLLSNGDQACFECEQPLGELHKDTCSKQYPWKERNRG